MSCTWGDPHTAIIKYDSSRVSRLTTEEQHLQQAELSDKPQTISTDYSAQDILNGLNFKINPRLLQACSFTSVVQKSLPWIPSFLTVLREDQDYKNKRTPGTPRTANTRSAVSPSQKANKRVPQDDTDEIGQNQKTKRPKLISLQSQSDHQETPAHTDLSTNYSEITSSPPLIEDSSDEEEWKSRQWRVGKMPGHQGAHVRTPIGKVAIRASSPSSPTRKRSVTGMGDTAARILKKPFQPPRQVLLAPAKPKLTTSMPSSSSLSSKSSSETYKLKTPPIPSPVYIYKPPTRSFGSKKATKPFKSPFIRSSAPSPMTTPNSRSSQSHSSKTLISINTKHTSSSSEIQLIQKLEAKARSLRQAVSYITNPDEDERTQNLIDQWRMAGREVVEKLFDRIPKPTDEQLSNQASINNNNNNNNQTNSQYSSIYNTGSIQTAFQGDSQFKEYSYSELPDDLRLFIEKAPKNEDGEVIDSEGNLLFDIGEESLKDILADTNSGTRYGKSTYRPEPSSSRIDESEDYIMSDPDRPKPVERDTTRWDFGTLMLGLGVDPSLLGWNDDTEDWDEN